MRACRSALGEAPFTMLPSTTTVEPSGAPPDAAAESMQPVIAALQAAPAQSSSAARRKTVRKAPDLSHALRILFHRSEPAIRARHIMIPRPLPMFKTPQPAGIRNQTSPAAPAAGTAPRRRKENFFTAAQILSCGKLRRLPGAGMGEG